MFKVSLLEDNYFRLQDGSELKSVKELVDNLNTMDDEVFSFHVNENKNDFSNWIRDVFGERIFSAEISTIRNKSLLQAALYQYLHQDIKEIKSKVSRDDFYDLLVGTLTGFVTVMFFLVLSI